jgi:hypothetical protein
MKQTAVEWLIKEFNLESYEATVKFAKEMEKRQIIEAHGDKKRTKSNPGSCVTYGYTFTGEMYYNETFKSDRNETEKRKTD